MTTVALPADKAALRKQLRAARRAIDPAHKLAWDTRICAGVLALCTETAFAELAVYWPLAGEPDLHPAYIALFEAGVRLALPVVHEKDAPLSFAHWEPGEEMVRDHMGVAVPAVLRPVARPAAILVPCLGFNACGYRLGYGGGYYDRTLAPRPRPFSVGVAYALAAAAFDGAPHDVALDRIITEQG